MLQLFFIVILNIFIYFYFFRFTTDNFLSVSSSPPVDIGLGWPSGPRRLTQVQVSSEAWVRIPLQATTRFLFALKLFFHFPTLAFCLIAKTAACLARAIGLVV